MGIKRENIQAAESGRGIELRLYDINQLFNSMDPSPFREKDLDQEAEEFIVGWARDLHRHDPLSLTIYLGKPLEGAMRAETVTEAVHNHFNYLAEQAARQERRLLREGWKNLVIGLTFLSLCLFLAQFLDAYSGNTFVAILKEGMIIGGWVAMWRPMEIFLYSRWPIKHSQQLYTRLGSMDVRLAIYE